MPVPWSRVRRHPIGTMRAEAAVLSIGGGLRFNRGRGGHLWKANDHPLTGVVPIDRFFLRCLNFAKSKGSDSAKVSAGFDPLNLEKTEK